MKVSRGAAGFPVVEFSQFSDRFPEATASVFPSGGRWWRYFIELVPGRGFVVSGRCRTKKESIAIVEKWISDHFAEVNNMVEVPNV